MSRAERNSWETAAASPSTTVRVATVTRRQAAAAARRGSGRESPAFTAALEPKEDDEGPRA